MWNSVLSVGNQEAMPVEGCFLMGEPVVDVDTCGVAFPEYQSRAGDHSVDTQSARGRARERKDLFCDF